MRFALTAILLVAACGKNTAAPDAPLNDTPLHDVPGCGDCDAPTDAGNPLTPDTLAGTGLCLDASCTMISPGVTEYTPRWGLWADGSTKRRWFKLPAGMKIDTSDMNYWKFPIGTQFWKEFTRGGVKIETRYIVKLADEATPPPAVAWFYISYQWNMTGDATVTASPSGVMNVNGTTADIPSKQNCKQCHESLKGVDMNRGRILGFGAVQLDFDGEYDLEDLIAGNLLTAPPTTGASHARFALPGTQTDIDAYGYLHANCGHCHNPTSPTFLGVTQMVLRYDLGHIDTVANLPQFMTTVNATDAVPYTENSISYTKVVIPHDLVNSTMIGRMNSTTSKHMPQLGSEVVDPDGQTKLDAWINSLQ
jgi:hypothetical protein